MHYQYNITNPHILKRLITLSCYITDYCYINLYNNSFRIVVKDNIDKYQLLYTLYTQNNNDIKENMIYKINLFDLKKICSKIHINKIHHFCMIFEKDKLSIDVVNNSQSSSYHIYMEKIDINDISDILVPTDNNYVNLNIYNLYTILNHIKDLDDITLKLTLYQDILNIDFYHINYKGNIIKKLKDNYLDKLEININKNIFLKVLRLNIINHIGKLYMLDNYNILEIKNEIYNLQFIYK